MTETGLDIPVPAGDTPAASTRSTGQEDVVREMRPVKRRVKPSELWHSRGVAWVVAVRDLKVRYKQSVLGPAWLILQPLGVLAGMIIVFRGVTDVPTGGVPYLLFGLTSLSAWTFFLLCVSLGTNVYVMNSGLVRRVAFPRTALLTATIVGNMLPAGLILLTAIVGLLIDRGLPTQALLLPFFTAWLIAFSSGTLFVLASLTVRFRDTIALVPFWLQVGLFLTPVGYPIAFAPETLQALLAFNPLSGILELWRWCLLGTPVATLPVITAVIGTVLALIFGWRIFTRLEVDFADHV